MPPSNLLHVEKKIAAYSTFKSPVSILDSPNDTFIYKGTTVALTRQTILFCLGEGAAGAQGEGVVAVRREQNCVRSSLQLDIDLRGHATFALREDWRKNCLGFNFAA